VKKESPAPDRKVSDHHPPDNNTMSFHGGLPEKSEAKSENSVSIIEEEVEEEEVHSPTKKQSGIEFIK
jgi:hypothetical protein